MLSWVLGKLPVSWFVRLLCAVCHEALLRWPSIGEAAAPTIKSLGMLSFRKLTKEEIEHARSLHASVVANNG